MTSHDLSLILAKVKDCQVELSDEDYEFLQQPLSDDEMKKRCLPTLRNAKGGFVRFRGMVQDMMNPEYVIQGAPLDVDPTDLVGKLSERLPLLLVPLPFCSEWFRDDDQYFEECGDHDDENCKESKKRDRDDSTEDDHESLLKRQTTVSPKAISDFSRDSCRQSKSPKRWCWPPGFMGSDPKETPVISYFYNDIHKGPKLRLNDVVEVIGINDAVEQNVWKDESVQETFRLEDDLFEEEKDQQVTSLPQIHVVCHRRIDLDDLGNHDKMTQTGDMDESFEDHIANLLGNRTAAEAMLTFLFSVAERSVSTDLDSDAGPAPVKTPFGSCLGCASLKLTLPSLEGCFAVAEQLLSLLEKVLPIVGKIELDDRGLVPPVKVGAHLTPSPFQLPKGALIIVIDNRSSRPTVSGETLEAVQCMTEGHSIPYKFDGDMKFNFEADYRVLVLSPAGGTCPPLTCNLTMRLHDPCLHWNRPENLNYCARQLRSRLALGRTSNVTLGPELLAVAQQDFVNRRQTSRDLETKLVGEEDFHRWLTLTRLCARREGRSQATIGDWKNALRLDDDMRKI